MNTIFTALYILGFLSVISGKTIANVGEPNNYARYALNFNAAGDKKGEPWRDILDDNVNGAYSLSEPDGNLGIVEYSTDDINGFSALVKTIAAALNNPQPYLKPLFIPLPDVSLPFLNAGGSYGFGAANIGIGIPSVKVSGSSLPWDPKTGSFGGWIPIRRPTQRIPKATILKKKYVNGHLRKVMYRPIPLPHRSVIVIKKRKNNYD